MCNSEKTNCEGKAIAEISNDNLGDNDSFIDFSLMFICLSGIQFGYVIQ